MIASMWGTVGWRLEDGWRIQLRNGRIASSWLRDAHPIPYRGPFASAFIHREPFYWHFRFDGNSNYHEIAIPLWPLVAILLVVFLVAWRFEAIARRRHRTGLCENCGYERKGTPETAPCPECGNVAKTLSR